MKNQKGSAAYVILYFAMVIGILLSVVGWFLNAYRLTNCDFQTPYKCEVVRVTGIFVPPVGAVTGYMDLGK